MKKVTENLLSIFSNILSYDWLILPVGLFWYAFLGKQFDFFIYAIFCSIIYYLIFQIFCYVANFLISLLYFGLTIIIIPIGMICKNNEPAVKFMSELLHCIFFTLWATSVYYFSTLYHPCGAIYLILYAGITLPFVYYGQKINDGLSDFAIVYVYALKLVSLLCCFSLLCLYGLFDINISYMVFGIIFFIMFCGVLGAIKSLDENDEIL